MVKNVSGEGGLELSLSVKELKLYIAKQIEYFLPDRYKFQGKDVDKALDLSLHRLEFCFRHITVKSYNIDNRPYFSHLHSDQYSQFLYFLSNSLWDLSENKILCDKIILLNKALHGIWYTYKANLPDVFLLTHPVGTVLGNADYSNFLVVSQNVTVNTNEDEWGNAAPKLGKGLFLGAGAQIIGNGKIGDRVSIGNVTVYKQDISNDMIAFRDQDGSVKIIQRKNGTECAAQSYFTLEI